MCKEEADNKGLKDFEKMLKDFKLHQPDDLNCLNTKKIERMCVDPTCTETSLTCNDLDCQNCHLRRHV